jgi:hypothetical protein
MRIYPGLVETDNGKAVKGDNFNIESGLGSDARHQVVGHPHLAENIHGSHDGRNNRIVQSQDGNSNHAPSNMTISTRYMTLLSLQIRPIQ